MTGSLMALALTGAAATCPASPSAVPADARSALEQVQLVVCNALQDQFETTKLTVMSAENVPEAVLSGPPEVRATAGALRTGRMPVTLEWTNSLNLRQHGVLWFRVNGSASAWVFARDLSAEAVIEETDIYRASVDIAAQGLSKKDLPDAPQSQAVIRSVRKGSAVRPDWLRPPALVSRKRPVMVRLNRDGLNVRTRGVALTTGWRLNDAVQVEVGEASKPVAAKVFGKDEVYVEM